MYYRSCLDYFGKCISSLSQSPEVMTFVYLFSEIKYSWVFNGQSSFLQQDARRFISQRTGNLYVAKVEASDEGNYTCVVRNMMTNTTVFSSPTPVVVRRDGKHTLSSPLPAPGYLAHWTDKRCWRGGRGAEINRLSAVWHCFCSCLLARFLHHPKKKSYTGLCMRGALSFCMKAHIYITRNVVCTDKSACRLTRPTRSLPHTLNPIRTVYVYHFRFELRQICNPNSSIR